MEDISVLILFDIVVFTESMPIRLTKLGLFTAFLPLGWQMIRLVIRETIAKKNEERKVEIKSQVMGIASHQLNTPLSSIDGFLSLMNEINSGTDNNKQKRIINLARNECTRLKKSAQLILSLSRFERGMGNQRDWTKIQTLANSISDKIQVLLGKKVLLSCSKKTSKYECFTLANKIEEIALHCCKTLQPSRNEIAINISASRNKVRFLFTDPHRKASNQNLRNLTRDYRPSLEEAVLSRTMKEANCKPTERWLEKNARTGFEIMSPTKKQASPETQHHDRIN